MTRRLKAPQRRARRAAKRLRESGEPEFNLSAVAARSAREPGMPARPWPGNDLAFIGAVLEAHNVPSPLAKRLTAAAAQLPLAALLLDRLTAALADQIHFSAFAELLRLPALLLVGPPGAGKTTLAAKLAARMGERNALLVSTDTRRPGALAQLEEYAGVLGAPVAGAADPEALAEAIVGAAGRKIIVDSAGIAPGDRTQGEHLTRLIAASGAEPLLVLPADSDAEEAMAMARAFKELGAKTLMPTRLDLAPRMGGLLAAADAGRLALPAAGITPHFAYGIAPLTPEAMARRLLAAALNDPRSQLPAA
ncbi:MAG TPA: AAA family ATPase [Stellaceae bacterium]|nr:AAA family ATPase [Stellaceae bacterium]